MLFRSNIHIEGSQLSRWFLQVDTQPEVGVEAYDEGARIWKEFFQRYLKDFCQPDLIDLGQKIIQCCMDGGQVEDYETLIHSS